MEPNNINTSNENEPIEEIDSATPEAIEATDERPHGRGRRGMRGRRPFGPNRPYRFALFVEEDGSFVLRSPDLSEDAVPVASLDEVGATMRAAIAERAAEDAVAAAEAEKDADYSGKFVLRLPRSMHRQLAELAEAEGVSLNQLALAFLAQGMGRVDAAGEFGERRGPRGGHRGPGGHGPWGGRGRRGGRGPEGRGPEDRGFGGNRPEGRGPQGRGFGRRHQGNCGPDERFGRGKGPGFGREMGGGRRRPDFTGPENSAQPVEREIPRLV